MSSRAQAAVKVWLVRGGGESLTTGARFVLWVLADECDDMGDAFTCEVSEESLAGMLGGGVSTVRRHLQALEEAGVISRIREREPDGTWAGYRTSLSLEKLGADRLHRSNRAVAARPVDNPVGKPVDNPAPSTAQSTAQIEQPPPNLSGPKEVLPSLLPRYSWPSAEIEAAAARILSVAGRGLASPDKDLRVLASLAGVLESWLATFSLEDDIVPVVSARTMHRRKSPLWDLGLLTSDIWTHREARKKRLAGGGAPAPPKSPGREEAAARGLALTIAGIEDGNRPEILLHPAERSLTGEAREAAFMELLDRLRREHAVLLEGAAQ